MKFKLRNRLLDYRIKSFFTWNKKMDLSNLLLIFWAFCFVSLLSLMIWLGVKFNSRIFEKTFRFDFYQAVVLLVLFWSSFFSSVHFMLIKKQITTRSALALFAIGISRKDLFYDRFLPNLWRITAVLIPVVFFGFIGGQDRGKVFVLFLCSVIYVLLTYSIRLLILNLFTNIYEARYIELVLSLITYTLSFIFLPTGTLEKNYFWMQYFEYLSPIGWLNILTTTKANIYTQPYIYLYLILLIATVWVIWKTNQTTVL